MARERTVSFVDKLVQQAMGLGQRVGRESDPAKEKYPTLWDWLSTIYVGKDRIKQPPAITLTLAPDGVVVRVVDRDMARTVELVVPHLEDVFQEIEQNLNSLNPAIRVLGKKEPKLRKRIAQD